MLERLQERQEGWLREHLGLERTTISMAIALWLLVGWQAAHIALRLHDRAMWADWLLVALTVTLAVGGAIRHVQKSRRASGDAATEMVRSAQRLVLFTTVVAFACLRLLSACIQN
jgi:hypothetical protein